MGNNPAGDSLAAELALSLPHNVTLQVLGIENTGLTLVGSLLSGCWRSASSLVSEQTRRRLGAMCERVPRRRAGPAFAEGQVRI